MNKTWILFFSLLLAALFSGCGYALKEIDLKSQSNSSGIFIETDGREPTPVGYADLAITVSVKTPVAGYYPLESKQPLSAKQELPFVFNIDGQAVTWRIHGQREVTSAYNEKGTRIPDGGEGMRYVLHKTIRLNPGPHTIFFGYPKDECTAEFRVSIQEGTSKLEYEPFYRRSTASHSFLNGVSHFEVFYNGKAISS